jgi:hypothetical protein
MTVNGQTITAIDFAADLFRQARRVVVLSGAGISTPSGIPDFRSEGTGLWSRDEPMDVPHRAGKILWMVPAPRASHF